MAAALRLARRGLGNVWPNPAVGCVLVRDGAVVGRGWTQPGGRPHAETEALRRAGEAARGATAYVTLEPCSHHGKTPPCADALIAAGIRRCVVAVGDTDPRVSGQGIARLRAAGITVDTGLLEAEAQRLNAGFFSRIERGRPLVTLKLASTLDGRIALATGESKWITGPEARALVHRLRAENDAVLTGAGTVAADDPELTCRLPGGTPRPGVRVVMSTNGLDADCKLARVDEAPTWVIGGPAPEGVERIACIGRPGPAEALAALAERGITRVMIEAGGTLAGAFLRAGLIDRLVWFRAPKVIGGDGMPAIAALGLDRLAFSPEFVRVAVRPVGGDVVEFYERAGEG